MTKKEMTRTRLYIGYSMSSLDKRVERAFGCPVFLWMQDGDKLSTLLSDLQRREKSFDRKKAAASAGE